MKINNHKPYIIVSTTYIAYFLLAEIGNFASNINNGFSAIWPPSGFYVAMLLALNLNKWPYVIAGALLANWSADVFIHDRQFILSLLFSTGNTLEAVCGAFLIKKLTKTKHIFSSSRDIIYFFLFAALLGCAISSTVGSLSLIYIAGIPAQLSEIWLTWYLADLMSILILTPLLYILMTSEDLPIINLNYFLEFFIFLFISVILTLIIFLPNTIPLPLTLESRNLLILLIMIIAYRTKWIQVYVINMILFFLTVWLISTTVTEHENISIWNEEIVNLFLFWLISAVVALITSALTLERKRELQEKLELKTTLIKSEKEATMGTFAAGIAHEINNPLFIAMGNLEQLNKNRSINSHDTILEYTNKIDKALLRIKEVVQQVSLYTSVQSQNHQRINLHETINGTIDLYAGFLESNNTVIIPDLKADKFMINGDLQNVKHCFMILFSNAFESYKNKKQLNKIQINTFNQDESIVIKFSDNGCGMDEETLSRINDPFFSTKGTKNGQITGLGIPILNSIIKSLRGTVEYSSKPDLGTTVSITIPLN